MEAAVNYKFSLGQVVVFTPGVGEVFTVPMRGRVTRRLPREGDDLQYIVQVDVDGLERRVRQSQLRAV